MNMGHHRESPKGYTMQHPSEDEETKIPQPCSNLKGVKEAAIGQKVKNDALQLDQLSEELTYVSAGLLRHLLRALHHQLRSQLLQGCLQSVYQKCGMHCPKCRQELRVTSRTDFPINTVLWNASQLLFPQETTVRLKNQMKTRENYTKPNSDTMSWSGQAELRPPVDVTRRISRPTPWRDLTIARGHRDYDQMWEF